MTEPRASRAVPDKRRTTVKTVNMMTDKGRASGQAIDASADQASRERRDVAGVGPVLGTVGSRRYNLMDWAGRGRSSSRRPASEGRCASAQSGPDERGPEAARSCHPLDRPHSYASLSEGDEGMTRAHCAVNFAVAAAAAAVALPASWRAASRDLDGDGDVDLADFGELRSCWVGPDMQLSTGCAATADFDGDGDVDLKDFSAFQTDFTGQRVRASIPAKHIDLELIGIHDEASENYNGDCLGCHADRLNEVALDGVTPTAHSQMLRTLGGADWLCVACHSRLDFLTQSASNLREQVDMEETGCTSCHNQDAAPGLPKFYVR